MKHLSGKPQIGDAVYNTIWKLGIRFRDFLKRHRLLGVLEPIALRVAPRLVAPPAQPTRIVLGEGITMLVPAGYPAARSLATGMYERATTRLFNHIVKEGMTVADLGANVGYYTILGSVRVGPSGTVYAFEPDPENYKCLEQNLQFNHVANVHAVQAAVADKGGRRRFARDPGGAEGYIHPSGDLASGAAQVDQALDSQIEVRAVSLDGFFGRLGWPAIDIVKMDVEGSEADALRGMRELSARNPQMKLIIELNRSAARKAGSSLDRLAEILLELGYRTAKVIERDLQAFPISQGFPNDGATHNLLLTKAGSP